MRLRFAAVAIALAAAASCGGDNGPGPLPPPPFPQITCSSAVTIDNVNGESQAVSFPAPTTSGGSPPVFTTCNPASGSTFPLGETPVACTAIDALGRQAACGFTVTLRHQLLTLNRFMAYGDSFTEGENGLAFGAVPFVDTQNAYPTVLRRFFVERIPSQTFTVINAGKGGERITENEDRLKERLDADRPQVLLLLQGINDMIGRVPARDVGLAVSDSIRRARERGVQYVFVGTLTPQARENCLPPPGPRCRADDVPQALLMETNQVIRSTVAANAANGAHLVEVYDQLVANRTAYAGVDGLHFRPEGYRALADVFWNRIVQVIPAPQLAGQPADGVR